MKNTPTPLDSQHPHIHLNGLNNSLPARKHDSVKSQIDLILQKDYLNWKVSNHNFDPLNSFTAKSSDLIHTYVKGIYSDYQIQDPLQETYTKFRPHSFISQSLTKNAPLFESKLNRDSMYSLEKSPYIPLTQSPYQTPIKTRKKGLQVINSKGSKQKFSIQKQEPIPEIVFSNPHQQLTPQKVKFIERTAHSPESSFELINSKNQGWSSTEMGLSAIKNMPTRDSLLFNSKISLDCKQPQNVYSNYLLSNKKLSQQNLPLAAEFKSTRQFLSRRKYKDLSKAKQAEVALIGSEVSLGENNPEREQKRIENLEYASEFMSAGRRKTLFEPEQSVKQSFRYCVGCEDAILEANIHVHEDKCGPFKEIVGINNVQSMITKLDAKLERMAKQIIEGGANISEKDHQSMRYSSNNLSENLMKLIKVEKAEDLLKSDRFIKDYDTVIETGTRWGHLTEQVNKLKWFLLIKRNFQSLKFNEQSHPLQAK